MAEEHDGAGSGLGKMDGDAVRLDAAMDDLSHASSPRV
jgi:hypothetical protein